MTSLPGCRNPSQKNGMSHVSQSKTDIAFKGIKAAMMVFCWGISWAPGCQCHQTKWIRYAPQRPPPSPSRKEKKEEKITGNWLQENDLLKQRDLPSLRLSFCFCGNCWKSVPCFLLAISCPQKAYIHRPFSVLSKIPWTFLGKQYASTRVLWLGFHGFLKGRIEMWFFF